MILNNPHLRRLDISKSCIGSDDLRQLLKHTHKNLQTINLHGCYGAPRGWRREISQKEFKTVTKLCKDLSEENSRTIEI